MKSEDIGDVFTPEGIQKLKQGQLLRFEYEGSIVEYIITKLNRKSGRVFARQVRTYHPDEVQTEDAYGDKEAFDIAKIRKDAEHA
jgi:bifunctional DNA-binding transcriptional regulator/antitoxin component of YhaV-PrlF toxin-antitoxin module